ncbi:putative disease resistance protein RGA3 [Heracleum sosnowskyi]|uniref:Disease resistance protein RGA3 n=1 Tax=Heracleum sosnowskyi TaxID=360622 RepID=A0AAD8JG40_9APIA|nr:putative disease resistance protein RGA3 [Heracleum sosnowskyi]
MGDAVVADLASRLVLKLVSLATEQKRLNVANVFMDELAHEFTRRKVENRGETFLLVLDDVWTEPKPDAWDNLRNYLLAIDGARGSKILVTTRNQEVIDAIRCSVPHRVEKILEEDSWVLFKKIAFSQGGVVETHAFTAFGRSMVKRCGGLPLAIKTLGGG